MISVITRWFEPVTASQDYQRTDYVALWLILAVGAVVRFWGLGNVGLHGDEETMAMPAMAVLENGQPLLPSGMYYARALLNVYLMSGSAWLFGESEWAFRLPSALVGSLTGLASFYMGRRFLSPRFNLAFVATLTLLPGMIEISQTARMYVFFVTCVIWFAACLFRWERDQRLMSLIWALLAWLLALHFHTLAIFAAPLFLFPGLSQQSWALLFRGTAAFATGGLFFYFYDNWISAKYPQSTERPPPLESDEPQTALDILMSGNEWLLILSLVVIAVFAIVPLYRFAGRRSSHRAVPVLLVGFGLLAMAVLQYHVGGILLLLGTVFWLRTRELPRFWLLVSLIVATIMAATHLGVLYESGQYPGRKLIGALIGTPSVWPVLRFLQYSPFSGAVYGGFLLFALSHFAKGRRLPMHVLFFAMGVWAPLLILGFFAWNVPPRYAQGQLGFFLLCTFAAVSYIAWERRWLSGDARLQRSMLATLVLISAALINPVVLWHTVNPGYDNHPDHKGAAEFIQSLELPADTILIAEDVLQQFYYLGKVDYSLRPIDDAVQFSILRDGKMLDQYTGAEVLGTGAELEELVASSGNEEVFVIGSGENFVDGQRLLRGHGIAEVLESNYFEVVYEGRDGKTKVWKKRRL